MPLKSRDLESDERWQTGVSPQFRMYWLNREIFIGSIDKQLITTRRGINFLVRRASEWSSLPAHWASNPNAPLERCHLLHDLKEGRSWTRSGKRHRSRRNLTEWNPSDVFLCFARRSFVDNSDDQSDLIEQILLNVQWISFSKDRMMLSWTCDSSIGNDLLTSRS